FGLLTNGRVPPPRERFHELLQAAAESARADEAVEALAGSFLAKLPTLPGDLFAQDSSAPIALDTVLERLPGMICRVSPVVAGQVTLHFPGGRLDGPAKIAPVLRFIARTPRFVFGSLPDDLTTEGKRVLVRRLMEEHVLRVAQEEPPSSA